MSERDDAFERELRTRARREPSAELRGRVLRSLAVERGIERGRRLRAERIAGGVLALAAAALLLARLLAPGADGPARSDAGRSASLDTLRADSSRLALELGLERHEDLRLALLAFGGADLPRVAPAPRSLAPQGER